MTIGLINYNYPECDKRIEMYKNLNEVEDCSKKIGSVYGIIITIILCIIAFLAYLSGSSNKSIFLLLLAIGAYMYVPELTSMYMKKQWVISDYKIRSMMSSDILQLEQNDPIRYANERLNIAQKIISINQQDELINAQNITANSMYNIRSPYINYKL